MAQFIKVSDSKSEFAGIAFGNAFAASLFGFLQKTQKPIKVETNSTRFVSGIYDHSFDEKTFSKGNLKKNEMKDIFEMGDNVIIELQKTIKKLASVKEDYKCLYDQITYHNDQFSKLLRLLLNEIRIDNEVSKNPKKEREKQLKRCRKYVKNLPGFLSENDNNDTTDIEDLKRIKRQKTDANVDKNNHFILIRSGVVVELTQTPRVVSLSEFWKTLLIKNKLVTLTKIYNLEENLRREIVIVIRSLLDVDGVLCEDAKIVVLSLLQKVFAPHGFNPHLLFSEAFSNSSVLTKIHSLVINDLRLLIAAIDDRKDRLNCFVGLCSKNGILVPDEITCIEYPK